MPDHPSPPQPQPLGQTDGSEDWLKAGELLVTAELLSQENLESSVALASKMRMPLDRMLSMNGYLSDAVLGTALKIQAKVRSGQMSPQEAARALQTVRDGGKIVLDDAVRKPRAGPSLDQPLGEALRASGAITTKQLKTCLTHSVETGLPVGWLLASQGTINQSLLISTITAQRLCQKNVITQDEALHYLRTARMQQKPIRKVLKESNVSTKEIDSELLVGHILIESGVIVRTDLLACQEFALLENKELAQELLDLGMLDKKALTAVEAVFAKVVGASLSTAQAIEVMQKLKRREWNMDLLDAPETPEPQLEIGDLIQLSGLVPSEKLQAVMEQSRHSHRSLGDFMLDDNLLESSILEVVEKCKDCINKKLLNLHKALILLSYCADNRCTLEEALSQFGWSLA